MYIQVLQLFNLLNSAIAKTTIHEEKFVIY